MAEHRQARDLGADALRMAQQNGNPLLVALDHWYLGVALFAQGEFAPARQHFLEMIDFHKHQDDHLASVALRGSDAGLSALSYEACCLWCLGFPEQALQRSHEALALAN
jgi:adenylate cyclase